MVRSCQTQALKTLPRVPGLSLGTFLEIPGSSASGKLVFRSDFSPTATKWSSTILTSRTFSLDPAPLFAQSVIPTHLLTSFVASGFPCFQTPWPSATSQLAFRGCWSELPHVLTWLLSRCPPAGCPFGKSTAAAVSRSQDTSFPRKPLRRCRCFAPPLLCGFL